jgi:hypothetical protein
LLAVAVAVALVGKILVPVVVPVDLEQIPDYPYHLDLPLLLQLVPAEPLALDNRQTYLLLVVKETTQFLAL